MFQNCVRAFSMLFLGRTLFGANLFPGTLLRNISTVCDKNFWKLYSGSSILFFGRALFGLILWPSALFAPRVFTLFTSLDQIAASV